jgi:hypothetical protein
MRHLTFHTYQREDGLWSAEGVFTTPNEKGQLVQAEIGLKNGFETEQEAKDVLIAGLKDNGEFTITQD